MVTARMGRAKAKVKTQNNVVPLRTQVPTDDAIMSIPLAKAGEYELSDREVKTLRYRIYALNKNNAAGWRWRTLREGRFLMVWRIR